MSMASADDDGRYVGVEQERLDRALVLDAEENEAWARDALWLTSEVWAGLEWDDPFGAGAQSP